MSIEIPLQQDIFTHEFVDTRNDYRKRQDHQQEQPQQSTIFSARETVQMGVNARPWLKDLARPPLILEILDLRTEEEKERDQRRAAEALTQPMFTEAVQPVPEPSPLIDLDGPEYRVPLFHLGKAELMALCPDMKQPIEQLKDTDIEAIACQAEAALQQIYQMVMQITLSKYLTEKPIAQKGAIL